MLPFFCWVFGSVADYPTDTARSGVLPIKLVCLAFRQVIRLFQNLIAPFGEGHEYTWCRVVVGWKGVIPVDGWFRNPAFIHQLRVGSLSHLFTRFYTSQVVVWDFWNINSMMSGGGKIWRLTWALGDIICWMFSDAIRRRLFYFQGVSMSLSKKGWSRVDSFSNESTVETEPSFTQKRSWRDRRDVW